jgi:hypothetical protein
MLIGGASGCGLEVCPLGGMSFGGFSVLVCVYKAHFFSYILPQPRRAILGGNQ